MSQFGMVRFVPIYALSKIRLLRNKLRRGSLSFKIWLSTFNLYPVRYHCSCVVCSRGHRKWGQSRSTIFWSFCTGIMCRRDRNAATSSQWHEGRALTNRGTSTSVSLNRKEHKPPGFKYSVRRLRWRCAASPAQKRSVENFQLQLTEKSMVRHGWP